MATKAIKKVAPVMEEEDGSTITVTDEEIEEKARIWAGIIDEPVVLEDEDESVTLTTQREYRLELFEEGDNRVYGRQRGLAREGWDFPAIHGFQRTFPMGNRAPDRFLILVASRDTEVPS